MSSNIIAALPQLWAIRPDALTAFVETVLSPLKKRTAWTAPWPLFRWKAC